MPTAWAVSRHKNLGTRDWIDVAVGVVAVYRLELFAASSFPRPRTGGRHGCWDRQKIAQKFYSSIKFSGATRGSSRKFAAKARACARAARPG